MDKLENKNPKVIQIEIIEETEQKGENLILKNGKPKILKPGHKIAGFDYILKPYLDDKVAKVVPLDKRFQKLKTKK